MPKDYEALSRELVRALRGRRSQLGLSRRLGYSTNALYTWEAGQAWPTAARLFQLAALVGVPSQTVPERFLRTVPRELVRAPLTTPEGIQGLVRHLLGSTRVTALAGRSGLSRFSLSRWLHGTGQPKLPEFLCFVDHSSLRLIDLVDALVAPDKLPSLADEWERLKAARAVGYEHPFSHAVLRALETTAYRGGRDDTECVARALGTTVQTVEQCLAKLCAAGQIERRRGRWHPLPVPMVDFRREPEAAQRLKAFWAQVAAERAQAARPGLSAYNVFAVSRADLGRLEALQRDFLREMRTIIAASEPNEVVALASFQIFDLGA